MLACGIRQPCLCVYIVGVSIYCRVRPVYSHNNVPKPVPEEIKKLMQDNTDANKDDLVSEADEVAHWSVRH